uniref:Major facilitator superfamily (MFS) profile domain-containing protein n=1 Tax=Seriola lalandi dorsalis TaxID=1841481 RepID=A0A3B4WYZ5_SERLL
MQLSVHDCKKIFVLNDLHLLCLFYLQFPNKSLLLAACAACIGGTFQYGYNISVINAPTVVITLLPLTGPFSYVHNFINQTWRERYQTGISEDVLTLLWSTIVSIFTLGGLIGATISGTLSVKLGRYGQK